MTSKHTGSDPVGSGGDSGSQPLDHIWLAADWPAPPRVHAGTSRRRGGISQGLFAGLNLADRVGDEAGAVTENRVLLTRRLGLPGAPRWLHQVHSNHVVKADHGSQPPDADGCYSAEAGRVCAVLTADCLPILMCDVHGTRVAALHMGWRGLAAGIIDAGLVAVGVPTQRIMVWLGPSIGEVQYEVDAKVRKAVLRKHPTCGLAFRATRRGHWTLDLAEAARQVFYTHDIGAVFGGHECTYSDPQDYYSFRRDGVTGRMASLIWRDG